jgi:type I restriction-modification system DNA methylase subunit
MSPTFNDRSLRAHLARNGFKETDMQACALDNGLTVPLVAFSHRPCDTRTACVSAIPTSDSLLQDLHNTRKTGAPLVFVQVNERLWDAWFHKGYTAQKLWSHEHGSLDEFFKAHKNQITPEAIFRAKTLGRLQSQQQLSFVDAGTLEMVEAEAGEQLCRLIERMMRATSQRLRMGSLRELDEKTAQWLVKANFWLLAARLLQDKNVPNFKRLDLTDIDTTFARVTRHYGAPMDQPLSQNRRKALVLAAEELKQHASLALVSTETLAHVYENALITPQTRKALGTHSTPSWLAEYIFSRLAPWIEAMPANRRHVYEPTCGHAPFLLGALRLLSAGKSCTQLDDASRHEWLKTHLRGSEIDDFAREVARLSLTLADIPNPNGWLLDDGDLFQGDLLEARIRAADIIVANPPFEAKAIGTINDSPAEDLSHVSRAAELLRRITLAARPGTLLGIVIPQTLLDSPKVSGLRATLYREFEWLEILRLPDKDVFERADVETAVLIGRRLPTASRSAPRDTTVFKTVTEDHVSLFAKEGTATVTQTRTLSATNSTPAYTLLLPDLADIWDHLKNVGTLGDFAEVGQGFSFKSQDDPTFPTGQTQTSETKRTGFAAGFYDFPKNKFTHEQPPLVWLNRNKDAIRRPHSGYAAEISQVVFNYAPIKRGPWRIAAYLDPEGHPATSRFLIARSLKRDHGLFFLWAILNSPVTNAFTKAFTGKRDILAGTMRQLPLPLPSDAQLQEIESAARAYLEACAPVRAAQVGKPHKRASLADTPQLPGFSDIEEDVSNSANFAHLRDLHWRMDAAVLRLYNLPPKLERQLLDYFAGHSRERVPFAQTEYIPQGFTAIHTLDELLAITADWPIHNERRSLLIDKECDGTITRDERDELKRLQKQTSLRRQLLAPYPTAELDEEMARLKREGKWA